MSACYLRVAELTRAATISSAHLAVAGVMARRCDWAMAQWEGDSSDGASRGACSGIGRIARRPQSGPVTNALSRRVSSALHCKKYLQ